MAPLDAGEKNILRQLLYVWYADIRAYAKKPGGMTKKELREFSIAYKSIWKKLEL